MCGIIGYIGNQDAVPIIVEGLKKLEYRGYDSAGLAVCGADGFSVVKQKGRLDALEIRLKQQPLSGFAGIGHTRWATHGEPSDVNSHPHVGQQNRIAVVHNGIIENYQEIKEYLQQKGVTFHSQTDSEVIAQLAEYYYDKELIKTVVKLSRRLEGSYALGIMCAAHPDVLVAVKKDNPLIIGVSAHGHFIASDIPAVLKHTNQVYYLEDNEIAVLTAQGVQFFNTELETVSKKIETVSWNPEAAEKGGYPHFMLKEIMEQPQILKDTIANLLSGKGAEVMQQIDIKKFTRVCITACGSAYNAGLVAKYVFERLLRLPVEVETASEFRYKDAIIDEQSMVILISQSGETADTIAAMREAKRKGAFTLSIVNVVGSTLSKESDVCIYTAAGPEIAVATTKAFSAQLTALYLLAVRFAVGLGRLTPTQAKQYIGQIQSIPKKVAEILQEVDTVQRYAAACVGYKSVFFIGRNLDYAIATEGSLKLKEISYIHSEAYAGGELKHGTISLIEDNTLVVTLATVEKLYPKILSNAEQVLSRGARVLWIGNAQTDDYGGRLVQLRLPPIEELFAPSLSVIVLQLFAYYIAANKGLDIDKPRNLAKSVTVE
ncbi:MAG: glutamine--fructose-6-phosphate transaminase (isomerizing) [Firmicutes bacterium]|nr:glutamine--fructose-6-phosphate transaminase (isomerizing) [Bacillota bacterium]